MPIKLTRIAVNATLVTVRCGSSGVIGDLFRAEGIAQEGDNRDAEVHEDVCNKIKHQGGD
jgi:hypothetical protein